jgi:hypothetical protein
LNVSEQQADQTSAESGSIGTGEAAPKVSAGGKPFGTTAPAAAEVEAPRIAPDQEETAPKPDALKSETTKREPAKVEAAKIEPIKTEGAKKTEGPKLSTLMADAPMFEAPKFEAPKFEAPKPEAPKFEALKAEAPKGEAVPKIEVPKNEVPKIEPAKAGPPKIEPVKIEPIKPEPAKASGAKVETLKADAAKAGVAKPEPRRFSAKPTSPTIMSAAERSWDKRGGEAKTEAEPAAPTSGKRRIGGMAALLVLAAVAGALGGALATTGLNHFAAVAEGGGAASPSDPALEASVARIDADLLALKANLEETGKTGMSQYNTTNDRLDKIEQTLAEPAGKLAKFSDAVDKMSGAPPQAAAAAAEPAAPKEAAGSVTRQVVASTAPASAAPPKPQVARLPTLDGWVLRDVRRGGALIEGKGGLYEVYAGDPVPGLGRVDAIRKQDGRWVVVTTKGLVVAR